MRGRQLQMPIYQVDNPTAEETNAYGTGLVLGLVIGLALGAGVVLSWEWTLFTICCLVVGVFVGSLVAGAIDKLKGRS